MARSDQISSQALHSVAEQIANTIQLGAMRSFPRDAAVPLSLGKTLALWVLKPGALEAFRQGKVPARLEDWAEPSDRWHHQIKFDKESRAFARSASRPADPATQPLSELAVSSVAEKIEQAVTRVEDEMQKDPDKFGLCAPYEPLIRLMEIPALRTTVLLLLNEEDGQARVLVVDSPPGSEGLDAGRLLTPEEFLGSLAAQSPPRGIA